MKKILLISAVLLSLVTTGWTEPWGGADITVTAGTAIRIVKTRTLATSIYFEMKTGGTGRGYILSAPPDVTCALNGAGTTFITELAAATSTTPGGNAVIPWPADPQNPPVNVQYYCVDGTVSSDVIHVAYNISN